MNATITCWTYSVTIMTTNDDFVAAVREMRRLQREYFKTRHPNTLAFAKKAERKVDGMLEELSGEKKPEYEYVGNLFKTSSNG